jgi:hypothetical protein
MRRPAEYREEGHSGNGGRYRDTRVYPAAPSCAPSRLLDQRLDGRLELVASTGSPGRGGGRGGDGHLDFVRAGDQTRQHALRASLR